MKSVATSRVKPKKYPCLMSEGETIFLMVGAGEGTVVSDPTLGMIGVTHQHLKDLVPFEGEVVLSS